MNRTELNAYSFSAFIHGALFLLCMVIHTAVNEERKPQNEPVVLLTLGEVSMEPSGTPAAATMEPRPAVPAKQKRHIRTVTKTTPHHPVPSEVQPVSVAEPVAAVADTFDTTMHPVPEVVTVDEPDNDTSGHGSPEGLQNPVPGYVGGSQTGGTGAGSGNGYETESGFGGATGHPGFQYLRTIIARKITYPLLARQMNMEGALFLSFLIREDGNVSDVKIVKSSGHPILDRNAVTTVRKSAPFPRPPYSTEIVVPVAYSLK